MTTKIDELIVGVKVESDTKGLDDVKKKSGDASKKVANDFAAASLKMQVAFQAAAKVLSSIARVVADILPDAAALGNEIDKTSKQLGLTAKEFQRLSFIQGQSGKSADSLAKAFRALNNGMNDAVNKGTGPVAEGLKQLGLTAFDLSGRSGEGQLQLLADGLNKVTDEQTKLGIAAKLFGAEAGADLIGTLAMGSQGLKEMGDQAEKLGLVLGDDGVEKAAEFTDQMAIVTRQMDILKAEIGIRLMPVVQGIIGSIQDWYVQNKDVIDQKLDDYVGKLSKAAKALWPVLENSAKMFGSFISVWTDNEDAFNKTLSFFDALGRATGFLADTLDGVVSAFRQLNSELDGRLMEEMLRALPGVGITSDIANAFTLATDSTISRRAGSGVAAGATGMARRAEQAAKRAAEQARVRDAMSTPTYGPSLDDFKKPGKKGGGGKGMDRAMREAMKYVRERFGSDFDMAAEYSGATAIGTQRAIEAAAKARTEGMTDKLILQSALGSFKQTTGVDVEKELDFRNPLSTVLNDQNVPDIQLSALARGAQPQILTSTINNTFNFDNDFEISGSGDPSAVGKSVVESFKTYFQEQLETTTKTVKVNFAR